MAYWLYKNEPNVWSWDDHVKTGKAGHSPKRSRNMAANKNLKDMREGDMGFFYHTAKDKSIVGIVKLVREYYPDPEDESGRFGLVDVVAVRPMPKPVSLADIKADPRLENMVLVRNSRLAMQPVSQEEWKIICAKGGLDPSELD